MREVKYKAILKAPNKRKKMAQEVGGEGWWGYKEKCLV